MITVVGSTGKPLMPTNIKRARRLLKKGRARIYTHKPVFTIQLLDREDGETQDIEYKCDTGYQYIGVSVVSKSHEYVSSEYKLLDNEPEKHRIAAIMRRGRRNHKRYRKSRFDNRCTSKKEGWLAPSIKNKMNRHVDLLKSYIKVLPITSVIFEMGQFNTQLLKAIEEGKPIPQGIDYQRGERYGIETLREAVFTRDNHTCKICKRSIKDNAILHIHHLGYWKGDHSNRLSNLATVCEKCHTAANHKKSGKLYGLQPTVKSLKGATFMTTVRWRMLQLIKNTFSDLNVHITYGAKTKLKRKELHIVKSHVNDAYAMGEIHPKHRCYTAYYKKQRRNNRVLEKFFDAKYIDTRDGKKKSGQELFSGRSKRNKNLNSENLHQYRKCKVSKGRRSIRRNRYSLRPGDIVLFENTKQQVIGVQNYGTYIKLKNKQVVPIMKTKCLWHCGGWKTS